MTSKSLIIITIFFLFYFDGFPFINDFFFRFIAKLIEILQNATTRKRQNATENDGLNPTDVQTVMTEVYRRIDKNHSDFLNTTTWLARTYARTVNPNKPMASLNESSSQSLNESLIELSRNFTLLMEDIEKECRDIGGCTFNQSNARDISGFYDDDDGIINYPYDGPVSYFEFETDFEYETDNEKLKNKTAQLRRLFSNKNGLEMTKKSIDYALSSTSDSGAKGKLIKLI